MSSSNCCFLTCIQISQEAGQVVWYSHVFQNFPQFIVIHRVKGFGIVSNAGIDVFLELSYFFHDPVDVGNLISESSAFSKTSRLLWYIYLLSTFSLHWPIVLFSIFFLQYSELHFILFWYPSSSTRVGTVRQGCPGLSPPCSHVHVLLSVSVVTVTCFAGGAAPEPGEGQRAWKDRICFSAALGVSRNCEK